MTDFKPQDKFLQLLKNTTAFSPEPDDDDIYDPSSHPTSSSLPDVLPTNFIIFSQNAHKGNSTTHAILNIASSVRPPTDIVLIQEPWYGKIGVDAKMAQGNPITTKYGCPSHPDWQSILPSGSSKTNVPDVIFYVPRRRTNWTFQEHTDVISSNHLMCLEINSSSPPFLIFNVYNDVDNSAVKAMSTLNNILPRAIFTGDFNLHHPVWSKDSNLDKHGEKADKLVELMANNGYSILNEKGVETFFVYRDLGSRPELYTSTIDLTWVSSDLHHFVSDFKVAPQFSCGSDHYPMITTISYANRSDSRLSFLFTDERYEEWCTYFELQLAGKRDIPENIGTPEEFDRAVTDIQAATMEASIATCSRHPKQTRRAKWFDSKVRQALQQVRFARKRMFAQPSQHTSLRYAVARRQLHYQVVVAKRSHARKFAAGVKPGSDLWRLNSWHQGLRKTVIPTLKDPNSDPRYPTWVSDAADKANLLATSWFPTTAPSINPPPHVTDKSPTRPYRSVTYEEIMECLNATSNTSAPGLSGLNYKVWKWVMSVAPDQLTAIIRASIKLGIHHPSWKQSLIAVIPKNNKKDMALPKSHRPIQLIECLGKIVEKVMAKRVTFNLGKYNLMPFNQFGGRSHSSCLDAALSLTHDIMEARARGLVSSFLAIDIKGFFDHVNHERLLDVMEHKGFPTNEVKWIGSFISERFVRVQVDDHVGDPHPQIVGLPQGSGISPVLACLYSAIVLEHLNRFPVYDETTATTVPVAAVVATFLCQNHDRGVQS